MKVMQLHQPAPIGTSPLRAVEVDPPQPGPGQVRLKIQTCGVCHTDLHLVEGDLSLPRLPTVPGHQVVGVVDMVGESVTLHQPGDRLGVPWLYQTCGRCRFCRTNRENLCEQIRFTGLHANGGFAEYMLADEKFAYPIPPIFSDVEAAPLLCAGVVGYRSLRLSRVKPGQRLGLYGFGASAHLVLQVACHWGCEVFVFTRKEHHRQLARSLGAVWAGGAEDDPGVVMDSSIIFAPAGGLVPLALQRLDRGGTLALGGIHMSPIPEMPYDLLWHERTLQSVANSTRQDVRDFLQVAAEIPLKPETELFPLEQANEALLRLKQGQINGAAVLEVKE
ncbi:MAG: alcohol dehydrogenase [Anaerolineae bacterium]|nr:zinc-dependent alcohol dehydrogenase family protein [Anaerolineales bacterium]MCQ3974259.1 alcohol dehydrogenase [Anaerolineae bacterium]